MKNRNKKSATIYKETSSLFGVKSFSVKKLTIYNEQCKASFLPSIIPVKLEKLSQGGQPHCPNEQRIRQ